MGFFDSESKSVSEQSDRTNNVLTEAGNANFAGLGDIRFTGGDKKSNIDANVNLTFTDQGAIDTAGEIALTSIEGQNEAFMAAFETNAASASSSINRALDLASETNSGQISKVLGPVLFAAVAIVGFVMWRAK